MKNSGFVALCLGSLLLAGALPAADPLTLLRVGDDGKFLVPADGALGTNWIDRAFNDNAWTSVTTGVGFDQAAAPVGAAGVLADSVAQFSGTQGGNNWYYGYWEKSSDPDGSYQSWEFTPFPREPGNDTLGANNFWDGSKWDWFNGNPPYTELHATGGHPAHHNGGGGAIHLPIRRWISPFNGLLHITGSLLATTPCGDGVIGRIFVDGEEVKTFPSAGATAEFAVNVTVQIGSTVDFAIDPGPANDYCDGFSFSAKILQNTIADSTEDWSATGQQGSRGWSYGFYNRTADGDATYHPNTDFITADPNFGFGNSFFGDGWYLGAGGDIFANPPWTTIARTDVHPNGVNNGPEHWAIRRYTSTVSGKVLISGTLTHFNCGGGTTARVFVDGTQVFARNVLNTSVGYAVLANVSPGSKIDLALDPNGDDGCDGTYWTATIQPAAASAQLVANSESEFSGTQGQDNWYYGYYNKTADGDATYDPNTDFNNTDPNWVFAGTWHNGLGAPPWDTIGSLDLHPNSGPEHWVIRRWVSEVEGPITIDWHFAKSNPNGGGATMLVLQNGVQQDAAAVNGNDRIGVHRLLALNVHPGDKIDFAMTPVGPGGDPNDGADGSLFNATIFKHDFNPNAVYTPVANSIADWSATGQQGFRGWTYGYYDKTGDGSPGYQATDFSAFPHDGSGYSPTDFWTGGGWDWFNGNPPWDEIGQTFVHPNGLNNAVEHWVIRRWTSTVSGTVRVDMSVAKANTFGSGVSGLVLHNGALKDSVTLAGTDTAGVTRSITFSGVNVGDSIDIALSPIGVGGATDDGADGSTLSAVIYSCASVGECVSSDVANAMKNVNSTAYLRLPFFTSNPECLDRVTLRMKYDDGFVAYLNGVEVARRNAPQAQTGSHLANSVADWTPAVQGGNNWSYGYYNKTADADHVYQPADFNPGLTWGAWAGAAWAYTPGPAPWTSIGQSDWHPNGDNNGDVHWVIRRWVSETSGDVTVNLRFAKGNIGGGNGVTGRLLLNGVQVFSQTIAFNDSTGVNTNLNLSGIHTGDTLDFALDPLGTDASENDGSDGSTAFLDVRQNPSPALTWNSRATAARSTTAALTAEAIDLTAFKHLLVAGDNVLAIHGLNRCVDDADFLLAPEITATVLPPKIQTHPASQLVQQGATATFSVSALSLMPASYQWRYGGVDIPGATDSTLSLSNVQPASAGSYRVVVSNPGGSTTSTVATLTVNRPPEANDNGAATSQGRTLSIALGKILANDSDPDGDPVTVSAVGSPTANGATVILGVSSVTYAPLAAFTGLDQFTYTISDGRGGTATATVQVLVTAGNLPGLNQVLVLPTPGGYLVRFAGIPGRSYQLQRSVDLNTWTTLQTIVAPLHGILEYQDHTPPPGAAFYRTVAP